MATITGSMAGVLRRPTSHAGIWGWVTTVDHKRIGVLYGVTSFIFFLVGGLEAMLLRLQLAVPNGTLIDPDVYNQLFTMHATTMVFLVIMPLSAAFFNFLVPLQIGARDVAFPRLNAFSYWVFVTAGIFINSSFLFGGAPNAGWFGYANLTSTQFNPGNGVDFWIIGLITLGTASLAASFNFIVTILNLRAPGMTLMRMPLFTWMTLVVAFLLIFAMPVIAVALIELMLDRSPLATNFFNPAGGGDPVLWQHLFWLFGHPEVYILILPGMGIVSEVLPTFARKPLFGYPAVVFAGVFIGFMGWGVWAHHMFTVGLGPVANSVFTITTMLIAVPTGVKIFNWIGTLWGGSLKFTTPMLFSIGFIAMFIIGGLSGVTHASPPTDYQQQDTYYIVAHFHYVLFGGAILALFSGFYFWWPKVTGKLLDETLGKWHFWLMFIGLNLTFGPMHVLGLNGMPRRIYTYPPGMGWEFWNLIETAGSVLIAVSVLVFIVNALRTAKNGAPAGNDPWDGRTLEWSIPSPPPEYNFAQIPHVHARDEFWVQKYGEHGHTPVARPAQPGHGDGHGIHMPQASYLPMVAGIGQTLMLGGLIPLFNEARLGQFTPLALLPVLGLVLLLGSVYAWCSEPVND